MKKDYELGFAKVIVVSILVFLALFYGNRYSINYLYVILAQTSLFVIFTDYDMDNGQETITGLITTTCAILISVLCCQSRMNLGLIILTGIGSLLGDVIILYSNQTRFNHRVFPFFVLATICASNIQSETYIKVGIIALTTIIVVLYAIYFYRAVIQEKILEKKYKALKKELEEKKNQE